LPARRGDVLGGSPLIPTDTFTKRAARRIDAGSR
jgi:hypothetical protein